MPCPALKTIDGELCTMERWLGNGADSLFSFPHLTFEIIEGEL